MKILFNGQLAADDLPHILVNDRGFLLGDGLFETLKAVNGKLKFFSEHYQRLKQSAEILGINFSESEITLAEKCQHVLQANQLQDSTAALRITLTRGKSVRGINIVPDAKSTLVITATHYVADNYLLRACMTSIRRNEYSPIVNLKTLNYLELILARKEAQGKGFDEGIMLNTKGAITETSVANLFFVIDGKVVTPKISDGVLPGIVRQRVMSVCQQIGIDVVETTLYPEQIAVASEIFQTNSLREIQSLSCVDSHRLLCGAQASITTLLKDKIDYAN